LMSPANLTSPSEALGRYYGWLKEADDDLPGLTSSDLYSLFLTLILGLANFVGYFVIMVCLCGVELLFCLFVCILYVY
jgi:hypothetical protein